MLAKLKAFSFGGEQFNYKFWFWLTIGLGAFLSTVSARMSHEQFKGRFGQIQYIPESWTDHFMSQADAYAIGLTIAIFIFSIQFFKFIGGGIICAFQAWSVKSDEDSNMKAAYAANAFIQSALAVGLGALVYMMMSFSWSQTNMIGMETRTETESRDVVEHPAVQRAKSLEEIAYSNLETARHRASGDELQALEAKADEERKGGRIWTNRANNESRLAENAKNSGDVYNETIHRNNEKSHRLKSDMFYERENALRDEIVRRRNALAKAEMENQKYAGRVNAVADSVFHAGQFAKIKTDNKTGPMLEGGIFVCAFMAYVLGAMSRGYFSVFTPGLRFTSSIVRRVKMDVPVENPEAIAEAAMDDVKHGNPNVVVLQNGAAPLTNEELMEQLEARSGFDVKLVKKPPFEIVKNEHEQMEIVRDWLWEQYESGVVPSDGHRGKPGVTTVIANHTKLPKTNAYELAHKVYRQFKKAQKLENNDKNAEPGIFVDTNGEMNGDFDPRA